MHSHRFSKHTSSYLDRRFQRQRKSGVCSGVCLALANVKFRDAADEFRKILVEDELRDAAVVVVANKQVGFLRFIIRVLFGS